MLVGAKVCELTEDHLWFVCGLYVGILTSPLTACDQIEQQAGDCSLGILTSPLRQGLTIL